MLSATKHLGLANKILRYSQDDTCRCRLIAHTTDSSALACCPKVHMKNEKS